MAWLAARAALDVTASEFSDLFSDARRAKLLDVKVPPPPNTGQPLTSETRSDEDV